MGDDASQIRQAIADTKTQLGDTLEALSYKTDVPARAGEILASGVGTAKETVEKAMDHVRSTFEDTQKTVRSTVNDVSENAQSMMKDTAETVKTSWKDANEAVNSQVKDLADRSEPIVHASQEKIQEMTSAADKVITSNVERTLSYVRENPITAAVGALIIGFILGRVLPSGSSSRN